jgi:hypothetical protein
MYHENAVALPPDFAAVLAKFDLGTVSSRLVQFAQSIPFGLAGNAWISQLLHLHGEFIGPIKIKGKPHEVGWFCQ